jgi:predicted amidohydrolase/ribosomal protein S18 acetylase RimI-like enzyme
MKDIKTTTKKLPAGQTLLIRQATLNDIDAINAVVEKCYGSRYPEDLLRAQQHNFQEGHFVATIANKIVGYCATLCVNEKKALSKHTWREITGSGFATTHDPAGEILYGYEICVDPDYQRFRIGQRFYQIRRRLCEHLNKKSIVFAGRIPNLAKKVKEIGDVETYVDRVLKKKVRDPVLNFQIRQGFEVVDVLKDYLPGDADSMGYGVLLRWNNSLYNGPQNLQGSIMNKKRERVRVATVQYQQRRISSFEEFVECVEYFVDTCSDYGSDFVVFPEFFSLQLLSLEAKEARPHQAIQSITKYENDIYEMFRGMAIRYNINIIGGSHPSDVGDELRNVAPVFLRDGSVYKQEKIHPTPNERYWWNISGGSKVSAIPTDCGLIGVLICYDSEFPELCRYLVNQGVQILFVPFLTDERQSYLRVRNCCAARAIENQIYVAMSGSCGNLPNVPNIDIHYAQSCVLTPCDFNFARDGIAADTTPNVEMVAFADLNINALLHARSHGTVRNLGDRRHDLYDVKWYGE